MRADPPATLLIAEVRKALEEGLDPGFAQKVAANALGIAQRELENGPAASEEEIARLRAAIAAGEGGEALEEGLIRLAVAQLAIDQPGYPPYRHWRERGGPPSRARGSS